MSIRVACPEGHSLKVPEKLAGKTVRCPKCSRTFPIPADDAADAEIVVIKGKQDRVENSNRFALSRSATTLLGLSWLGSVILAGLAGAYIAGRSQPEIDADQNVAQSSEPSPSADGQERAAATAQSSEAEAAAPSPTDESMSGSSVEELQADIREAVSMLRQKQYQMFIYDFMPTQVATQLANQTRHSRSRNGSQFLSEEEAADLITHLEAALTGEMTFNRNDTLAEVHYTRLPVELIPESPPDDIPPLLEQPPYQVPGLGDDLPTMLLAAADLLRDGQSEDFIKHVYPLAELARLSVDDAMERQLLLVETNEAMRTAMIRDLEQSAAAEIQAKGNVAETQLPPLTDGDPQRVLKFEMVDGNWRFFDGRRKERTEYATLVSKPISSYRTPGVQGVMTFARSDNQWRMHTGPVSQPLEN